MERKGLSLSILAAGVLLFSRGETGTGIGRGLVGAEPWSDAGPPMISVLEVEEKEVMPIKSALVFSPMRPYGC